MTTSKRTVKTAVKGSMVALALVVGAAGCVTPGKRTVVAGGAGAVIGAGVGAAVDGGRGAAVGAGVGGLAGAALGNYLDRRAEELAQVAETRRTERGVLVNLDSNLLFAVDSATLTPQSVQQVARVGDILARYPGDRIRVEGHTDSTGPASYNDSLSRRRAEAVARVLHGRGVRPEQVQVLGRGEQAPVSSNGTAGGRAENRRVEMHIDVPATRGG